VSIDPDDRRPLAHEEPLLAEIVDAELCDDAPAPRRGYIIAILSGILVVLILLALIAVGIAFIYRSASQSADNFDNAPSRPLPPTIGGQPDGRITNYADLPGTRRLADERSAIVTALDGNWTVADDDPSYREIRQLLSDLETAHSNNDRDNFTRLVDWSHHMERVLKYYRQKYPDSFAGVELNQTERKQFDMPTDASNFKIAVVHEHGRFDWYVYTYAQQGTKSHAAYLFRMMRQSSAPGRMPERNRELKLVDWAEVPELRWQAEANGLGARLKNGDAALEEQRQLIEEINNAQRLMKDGDVQGAENLLRQAEGRFGIPQLKDSNLYRIALVWHVLNNDTEAERILSNIQNPDDYPWTFHLAAIIQFQRGKHAEALEEIQGFERSAGFNREMMVIKTRCCTALGQKDQAEQSAIALLRYAPDDQEIQSLADETVSPERLSQLRANAQ